MAGSFLTNYSSTDEVVNIMRCMFAVAQVLSESRGLTRQGLASFACVYLALGAAKM